MNTIEEEEITAGKRSMSVSSEQWNQQTLVDVRTTIQTQQSSVEPAHNYSEQQSRIFSKDFSYPNHILHPNNIPSLNDVQGELDKRRDARYNDMLANNSFEIDMPLQTRSTLQDEYQRVVQNRSVPERSSDIGYDREESNESEALFQPILTPEQDDTPDRAFRYRHQLSFLSNALSQDKKSLKEIFQRISIVGDHHDRLLIEDIQQSVQPLLLALTIRERYMCFSLQSYSKMLVNFLTKTLDKEDKTRRLSYGLTRSNIALTNVNCPRIIKREDAFTIPLPPSIDMRVKIEKGIFCAYYLDETQNWIRTEYPIVDRHQFIEDYTLLSKMIADGPLNSFCHRRLQYLKAKYELHCLLNEVNEWATIKSIPHRDFYNVRKVDTHIHAASSMNQKHLLRFMKKKLKTSGKMNVYKTKEGRIMKLKEVFDELKITPYDLSVDMLSVHADRNTFQRFDRFNAKYNPVGQSILREIFLKTDNYIEGLFFADLLKEVISDIEESKYQNAELRLSIYGKSLDEWDKLASWYVKNRMYSANVAWMVQIPRLYDVYHANGIAKNFQEFLTNLFQPLFDATIDPKSHPDLFCFMHHLTGFDSVDDETKPERPIFNNDTLYPEEWNSPENPPYVYYLFYMYANILTLNQLRSARGLNTYQFRPHCGEAGAVTHLIASYMVAENISHGLLLRKSAVLQYLFYLCQIGIAMSPLSNNSLFIDYNRNPMLEYFQRGLFVSLSTDDPLQFHFTKEPLMEEYSVAAQVWKLSSVDMCELARNSVLMSGFSHEVKSYWHGPDYLNLGVSGNYIPRTNVPSVRIAYRYETYCEELHLLDIAYRKRQQLKQNNDNN